MSIAAAVAAIRSALDPIVTATIPSQPPDQFSGDWPMLIVYPQPGVWQPHNHNGRNGGPVIRGDHEIVIEWHVPFAVPSLADNFALATPIPDAIIAALYGGFAGGGLSNTVAGLPTVRCEAFGAIDWGTEKTFGVRMIADVQLFTDLSA